MMATADETAARLASALVRAGRAGRGRRLALSNGASADSVPVAVVKGELTRPFFRIAADTASRCIPGSRLIVIPNGRHNAPAEVPAAFNDALLRFLKDT
jgi:pimeloyl-ACP methyl ester carboxylesterase